jgi:benzoyl-CoA reductase/2-hydroxyglutaryl-CoA dehydratase subunit BcrC/BadD/HgdB
MTARCIGYTSSYLPPEIIWACSLTPVRLRPAESLSAADGYLPRNFSVEARALLAAALNHEIDMEAVVFLDEDDTSRRLFDMWRAYAETPALGLIPLPRLDSEPACQRYTHSLSELAESLAALSGQPLTADGLRRAVDLYNEQRALWRALRQRCVDGALSASKWHDLRWMALTTNPVSANAELATCLASLHQSELKMGSEGPRLLILGGMNIPRPFLIFLETCGARVVAEDSETEERVLTASVSTSSLDTLAMAYLTKPCGPRPTALSRRLKRITHLLDERGAQGVIAYYPKFADAYLAEYLVLAELFKARGLPALLLEDDGESGFSGQQRTRLEAFLEVLS